MENTKRKYEFNKLITTAQKATSFVVVVVDLPLKGHAYGRIGVALLPPPVLPRHHASTTLTQPRQLKPVPDRKQQQQQQKGAQKKSRRKSHVGQSIVCGTRSAVKRKARERKGAEAGGRGMCGKSNK